MKKFFLSLVLLSLFSLSALAGGNWYYLSSSGYLIRLDLENVTETGQVAAGLMPWGAASCGGHIYFSDFGSDQVFDYSPEDKVLNKVKINDETGFGLQEIALYSKEEEKKIKKAPIQKAFAIIHKPKPKPATYDANTEPLQIASHNKKVGLGSIACNSQYVFVVSSLKNKVEVISRDNLKRVASILVGERPSGVAVNPSGNILAISSTGFDKVYLADINRNFEKVSEVKVGEGPTDLAWLNDRSLIVLNRGEGSLSVVEPGLEEAARDIKLDTPVNVMAVAPDSSKIYALDGTEKKIYVINSGNYTFEAKQIEENLKFPNMINSLSDTELLIGSESDGRFLVLDTKTYEPIKKIQTNLPPKVLVKLIDKTGKGQVASNDRPPSTK